MDIKFFYGLLLIFVLNLFTGCGKKNNVKLGQNYYKMALLELSEKANEDYAFKQALDYVERAILQEEKAEYLALKATLLFKLGKNLEGNEFFDKSLSLQVDPKVRAEILNNKACLLADLGLKKSAENEIIQALKIWQELEDDKSYLTPEVALFNQSRVFIQKNAYVSAKEKLVKAINMSPGYLDAHYYLALVAYHLKDFNLAKKELKTVLFLAPEHEGAKYLSNHIDG